MKLHYLATPYSHKDPFVRSLRYEQVLQLTARLLQQGLSVYSPIVHSHLLAVQYGLPYTADHWRAGNLATLARYDVLLVGTMDGWEQSTGIAEEVACAREHGLVIEAVDPVTLERRGL